MLVRGKTKQLSIEELTWFMPNNCKGVQDSEMINLKYRNYKHVIDPTDLSLVNLPL